MSSGSATLSAALPVLRKEREGRMLSGFLPDAVIIAELPGEMFDKLRTFYERFVNESRGLGLGPLPGLWPEGFQIGGRR